MKKATLFVSMFVALFLIAVLSAGSSALAMSEEQSAQTSQEKQEKMDKKRSMGMQGDMPMCCRRKMGGKEKTEATMESMGETGQSKEGSAKEVKDPVCGMTVDPKTAQKSVHKGKTYYFCSKEDKETFEKSPEKYVQKEKETKKP